MCRTLGGPGPKIVRYSIRGHCSVEASNLHFKHNERDLEGGDVVEELDFDVDVFHAELDRGTFSGVHSATLDEEAEETSESCDLGGLNNPGRCRKI